MQITFWDDAHTQEFWDFATMLLKTTSPGVMISFALVAVGLLLGVIVNAWRQSSKEDEEEDYEIKHY